MASPRRLTTLLALALMAAACGGTTTPVPAPSPVPVVSVGLSALPLPLSLGQSYVEADGPLPFDLVPLPSLAGLQAVENDESLAHLDYPPPPDGWFSSLVGWEGIAIVVHPQVVIRQVDRSELAGIFSGRLTHWDQVGVGQGPILPVLPPDGDRLRQAFIEQVMPDSRITTLARLGPTPQAVLEIVAAEAGAIGLIPYQALAGEAVALLRLEGELPTEAAIGSGAYGLRVPLLAMAPSEPGGDLRDWLIWAQSSIGE